MPHSPGFTPIAASERDPLEQATRVGPTDPRSEMTVSVIVRRRGSSDPAERIAEIARSEPALRRHLSHEEFEAQYGADPEDLDKVESYAQQAGLTVEESSASRRTVVLRGTAQAMSQAFDVELADYEHPRLGRYRGRIGTVAVPDELAGVVQAVLGLDNRRQAEPQIAHAPAGPAAGGTDAVAGAAIFTPPQVAGIYAFPVSLAQGAGQCIGLIELGGGYRDSDLQAYFQSLGVAAPTVVSISVDSAVNTPGSADEDEVVLDVEVAGSIANAATIAVYFAPNSSQGFVDAITTAATDTVHKPSVISISWGTAEANWSEQGINALDQALADAATMGITVCCAAGDHGSAETISDGQAHVGFPGSSPHALACGGTHLEASGTTITLENVWNTHDGWASGGGVSEHFPLPTWQTGAQVPPSINPGHHVGRGVPDVAGDADPATGYRIYYNGQNYAAGGTSAVAPLWAALIALFNQGLGRRLGLLNPSLYEWPAPQWGCHDITEGNNEVPGTPGYSAGAGWDACTGLGSPKGSELLRALLPQFLLQTGLPITEADAAEHFAGYAVGPYNRDSRPDLYGFKAKDTGTNKLEVHVLARASDYQTFLLHIGTAITEQDAVENFVGYALADYNGDGNPDLFALKAKATGTGKLEVHILGGADNYQSFLLHTGTPILEQDALEHFVAYMLGDYNGDGRPDLFCLKARETGTGRLEVHVLSGADNYQRFLLQIGTPIVEQDAAEHYVGYALGQVNEDGRPDLFCLKASDTGTGRLEVHVLSAASNYQSFLIQTGTPIAEQDAAQHFSGYALGDLNADGYMDLFCLKDKETGTGRLELHVLNGARYYT
jgi:kumamolisin